MSFILSHRDDFSGCVTTAAVDRRLFRKVSSNVRFQAVRPTHRASAAYLESPMPSVPLHLLFMELKQNCCLLQTSSRGCPGSRSKDFRLNNLRLKQEMARVCQITEYGFDHLFVLPCFSFHILRKRRFLSKQALGHVSCMDGLSVGISRVTLATTCMRHSAKLMYISDCTCSVVEPVTEHKVRRPKLRALHGTPFSGCPSRVVRPAQADPSRGWFRGRLRGRGVPVCPGPDGLGPRMQGELAPAAGSAER